MRIEKFNEKLFKKLLKKEIFGEVTIGGIKVEISELKKGSFKYLAYFDDLPIFFDEDGKYRQNSYNELKEYLEGILPEVTEDNFEIQIKTITTGDLVVDPSNDIICFYDFEKNEIIGKTYLKGGEFIIGGESPKLKDFSFANDEDEITYFNTLSINHTEWNGEKRVYKHLFQPKEMVLVRNDPKEEWESQIFVKYIQNSDYPYKTLGNKYFKYCIQWIEDLA